MKTIIKNGKILLPEKVIEDHFLIIENNIIKDISKDFNRLDDYQIIDAGGHYVSPGFFDTHIHGAGKGVFETVNHDMFSEIFDILINNGITTVLPTLLCNESHIKNVVKNINSHPELKNRIAGIYIEGPFVNKEKKGGINPSYIKKPDLDYLKKIIDISEGYLKMMTIAPELEGIDLIIEHLLENNIIPALGHSMSSLSTARSKKGVKNITHLFNAMSGISHKIPGLAALPFVDKNIFVEINGDGVHIDNQILKMCYDHLNPGRIISITDAVISAGLPYGNYLYDTDKKVTSSERGVRYVKNDVLIGSVFLIPDVLRNLKKNTNASLTQLINSVSLNPAKMLSLDNHRGSIEKGKRADLVIFDEEFKIREVITG